jgi:hypothetical protein
MNWNDVLDRMRETGLPTIEDTYMENYGKILSMQRPEFRDRQFRCAYGQVTCGGMTIEAFLFPSESHMQDFLEILAIDPWWISHGNIVLHFPESDPALVERILDAIAQKK